MARDVRRSERGFALQSQWGGRWIGSPHYLTISRPPFSSPVRSLITLTGRQAAASKRVAGASAMYATHSSLSNNPPAGIKSSAVLRRPGYIALLGSFVVTHFTLAWALVPPVYFFLRQTNMSNSLLAGPQGAWLLSRKVPNWMPDVIVDGLAGTPPAGTQARGENEQLTIEQVLERVARRGIRIGWGYAKVGSSAVQKLRNRGQSGEDELAEGAMRSLGAKDKGALSTIKEQTQASRFGNVKDTVFGYTRRQVRSAADEIQFGQIRDGVAAWVLVKILFPVRLPVSLWLTPKVARVLMKAFGR